MAKKASGGKTSSKASSSIKSSKSVKAASKRKRISYKQEYVKLLEKTNKTLFKEVKAIRKAIVMPQKAQVEAFPKEPTPIRKPAIKVRKGSVQEQILAELSEISYQINARDTMFDDLVNSPGKITGDYFND
jgi:hypothetical protein